jgi:hypothetical protein
MAFDDGDDVVVVAKLSEVLSPTLLVVLVRAEEVVAAGVVFQGSCGGDDGQAGQAEGEGQDSAGSAAYQRHECDEQTAD